MGVLTDIFIASSDEAEKLGLAEDAWEDFKGIAVKGVSTVSIDTLAAIIANREDYKAGEVDMIFQADEEGPWIFKIPDELTSSLAGLQGEDITSLVADWHSTDELKNYFDKKTMTEILQEIIDLAADAVESGKGLLLWMCL